LVRVVCSVLERTQHVNGRFGRTARDGSRFGLKRPRPAADGVEERAGCERLGQLSEHDDVGCNALVKL
jgi:hypothetical protein